MEMNDLMALKTLENGMSPYEQVKVGSPNVRAVWVSQDWYWVL